MAFESSLFVQARPIARKLNQAWKTSLRRFSSNKTFCQIRDKPSGPQKILTSTLKKGVKSSDLKFAFRRFLPVSQENMTARKNSSPIEERESEIEITEVFSILPVSCLKCHAFDRYHQRHIFLACGHIFHPSCISEFWIGARFRCPICHIVGYGYDIITYACCLWAVGDRPRNFEPRSSDEDDSRAGILLSKLRHHDNGTDSKIQRA
ncbi:hypothetical protein TNCV_2842041 [Trichonephila clavipes]|uniref:RING-type domain-containing protein n=1 Tax=Trichonephila clavipes TaxID=2585209 RepID=A0A8X6RRR3_TRICX|nr:hypothetical protein TNCV_2842041 [Trichonephila clavipes]